MAVQNDGDTGSARSAAPPFTGLLSVTSAYTLWGFLPLYFHLLSGLPPLMILAHRILWSAPTAIILILIAGKANDAWEALRRPTLLAALFASGMAIAINWAIYIWAVTEGRILEGSLGYFINPLFSFAIAAVVFREKFNRLQVAAIVLAALGVVNQAVAVGRFPWIALSLGSTFAIYGAIRKQAPVDSRVGFGLEAMWLAPMAIVGLFFLRPESAGIFGSQDPAKIALVLAAGPVTAIPLMLFANGARRLKLSTTAMLQYIAPTLQFIIGLAMGEEFTPGHAVTFGLTWAGVSLFTLSSWLSDRRGSRSGENSRTVDQTHR